MLELLSGERLLNWLKKVIHTYVCVENGRLELLLLSRSGVAKDANAAKVEYQGYDELIQRLSNHHLPHV